MRCEWWGRSTTVAVMSMVGLYFRMLVVPEDADPRRTHRPSFRHSMHPSPLATDGCVSSVSWNGDRKRWAAVGGRPSHRSG